MSNANPLLPPNPCLIAILLVTQTRSGSRFVFHYPSTPSLQLKPLHKRPNWYSNASSGTSFDTDSIEETATFASSGNTRSDNGSDWMQDSEEEFGTGSEDDDGEGSEDAMSRAGSRAGFSRSGRQSRASGSVRTGRTRERTGSGARASEFGEVEEVNEGMEREQILEPHRLEENACGRKKGAKKMEMPWENVLGFSTESLEKLLAPTRTYHKRRFEVLVDGIVFLSAPMFVREDGQWRKHKRRKKGQKQRKEARNSDTSELEDGLPKAVAEGVQNGDPIIDGTLDAGNVQADLAAEIVQGFEPGYGHGLVSGAASKAGSEKEGDVDPDSEEMTMFNVVFVLNPPQLEYHLRTEEMYDNVTRRLARSLKHEQAYSDYVSDQVKIILKMKEQGKQAKAPMNSLWSNITQQSSLAKALMNLYHSIATSRIAHVNLNNGYELSFQIPEAASITYIPTPTEPKMPGLWLTTANLIDNADQDFTLSPHSALLLLEDKDVLLKEIETDAKELSGPMSFFVRDLTPTRSLKKLATSAKMTVKDALFLATHLIYWRRARAIPPLHHRDTYTVSPLADHRLLNAAIPAFSARFPHFPPLCKMLNLLSGQPRPYGSLIPSKDHRGPYMDMLAWLFRGGWVTQLRMFAWVVVPVEVKTYVDAKMELEKRRKSAEAGLDSSGELSLRRSDNRHLSPRSGARFADGGSRHENRGSDSSSSSRKPLPSDLTSVSEDQALSVTSSPRLPAHRSPTSTQPASDAGSTSSRGTTIQLHPTVLSPTSTHRPSPLQIQHSADISPSSRHSNPAPTSEYDIDILSNGITASKYEPSIIQSPQKASSLEIRWLEHIGETFPEGDIRDLWPLLLKYFDGRHALEIIAAREGLKRKRVWSLVQALSQGGWLLTVRHW